MRIIFVNGTTGVGKSTLTKALHDSWRGHAFLLNIDALRDQVSHYKDSTDSIASSSQWTARQSLLLVKEAVQQGYDVIIDKVVVQAGDPISGAIPMIWKALYEDIALYAEQEGVEFISIALIADRDIIIERHEKRCQDRGTSIDIEKMDLFLKSCDAFILSHKPDYIIDTSHYSADQVLQRVMSTLEIS